MGKPQKTQNEQKADLNAEGAKDAELAMVWLRDLLALRV
jgi:hypothetical protein